MDPQQLFNECVADASTVVGVTHLTLCGFGAGRPLCDCDKDVARLTGDAFVHAMFWHENTPKQLPVCPKCYSIWTEVD